MKKNKLVIFGVTELAQLAYFYFTHDSDYEVVGFTLDKAYIEQDTFFDLPVVPYESVQEYFPPSEYSMYIAIGYTNLSELRRIRYYDAKAKGYTLASYVSSKSTTWPGLKVGDNTFIMEDNTIMPFCEIGSNILIFVNNILSHHTVFKDHITITSHCAIGGNSICEEQTFFGLNCTTRSNLNIGKGAIIGAAANVLNHVDEYAMMLGNPAKKAEKDAREVKI
ncbi:MAG TPA: acetyltransferase [Flavobacterium sp.]|nr:acetyltransferase [Flavobacterium sp.]